MIKSFDDGNIGVVLVPPRKSVKEFKTLICTSYLTARDLNGMRLNEDGDFSQLVYTFTPDWVETLMFIGYRAAPGKTICFVNLINACVNAHIRLFLLEVINSDWDNVGMQLLVDEVPHAFEQLRIVASEVNVRLSMKQHDDEHGLFIISIVKGKMCPMMPQNINLIAMCDKGGSILTCTDNNGECCAITTSFYAETDTVSHFRPGAKVPWTPSSTTIRGFVESRFVNSFGLYNHLPMGGPVFGQQVLQERNIVQCILALCADKKGVFTKMNRVWRADVLRMVFEMLCAFKTKRDK
jgi:hypothetical protein